MNRLEEMNDRWFHVYSAAGERVATVDWQGAVSSREVSFTLRGLGNQVLARFELAGEDQSGNWSRDRDYVYVGARLLASDDGAGGGVFHYHLDHLGTPRLLTDASGDEASRHHYLPYGEETTAPGAEVMKFTGHERDLDAGQDYMHARYYQEHLGRFLSVDPEEGLAEHPSSLNRYGYAWFDPLRFVDPNGRVVVGFTGFSGKGKKAGGIVSVVNEVQRSIPGAGPARAFGHKRTLEAANFVTNNLHADQPVIIIGHSAGAASALELANFLGQQGVEVDLLVTIDLVNSQAVFEVSETVLLALNYYTFDEALAGLIDFGGQLDEDSGQLVFNIPSTESHTEVDEAVVDDILAAIQEAVAKYNAVVQGFTEWVAEAQRFGNLINGGLLYYSGGGACASSGCGTIYAF